MTSKRLLGQEVEVIRHPNPGHINTVGLQGFIVSVGDKVKVDFGGNLVGLYSINDISMIDKSIQLELF